MNSAHDAHEAASEHAETLWESMRWFCISSVGYAILGALIWLAH